MKRWIVFVVLLALTVILALAATATAKPEEPHFVMHAEGTLNHLYPGDSLTPVFGIPYWDGDTYVIIEGTIDVTIDVESFGDAIGPYDDGSDNPVKWDYVAKGFVTAVVNATDPDGNEIHAKYRAHVKRITLVLGYHEHVDLQLDYKGTTYVGYKGTNDNGDFVFLPFLGELLGARDGAYGAVYSSDPDAFTFVFSDPDVEL